MSLTENRACISLMEFDRLNRNTCVPRFTPPNWWECDVFELTKSGYFNEYEVKLTLADFRADAKKERSKYRGFGQPNAVENKHQLLAAGDPRGPARFSFVTPEGLIDRNDLPIWAGLIELVDRGAGFRPSIRWFPKVVVTPPKLHKTKADEKWRQHAVGSCYHRFHILLRAANDGTKAPTEWPDQVQVDPMAPVMEIDFEDQPAPGK